MNWTGFNLIVSSIFLAIDLAVMLFLIFFTRELVKQKESKITIFIFWGIYIFVLLILRHPEIIYRCLLVPFFEKIWR